MRLFIVLMYSVALLGTQGCRKQEKCSQSLLNKITHSQPLTMKTSWVGCFGGGKEQLSISKLGSDFHFTLTMPDGNAKSGKLSGAAIRQFKIMESKGKSWNGGNGCTTITQYFILVGVESVGFEDASCGFEEYNILKEKL